MLHIIITYDNGVRRFIPAWNAEIEINMEDKTAVLCKGKSKIDITQIKSIRIHD